MSAPIYGKKWYERSKEQQAEADEQFKAAVAVARAGSDEAVRQVFFGSCWIIFSLLEIIVEIAGGSKALLIICAKNFGFKVVRLVSPGAQLILDSFTFQQMVFLQKAVKPVHTLLADIRKVVRSNEPATKEQLQQWYEMSKLASRAIDDRIFIVMTAQSKGWNFAKDVNFYREGINKCFVS